MHTRMLYVGPSVVNNSVYTSFDNVTVKNIEIISPANWTSWAPRGAATGQCVRNTFHIQIYFNLVTPKLTLV